MRAEHEHILGSIRETLRTEIEALKQDAIQFTKEFNEHINAIADSVLSLVEEGPMSKETSLDTIETGLSGIEADLNRIIEGGRALGKERVAELDRVIERGVMTPGQ